MIRGTTVLSLLVAAALSLALFGLKYRMQDLEDGFTALNRSIIAERRTVHVLEAEWSHLNDPERLRDLATRHLGLVPVAPQQVVTLDGLPDAAARRRVAVRARAADGNVPPPGIPPVEGRTIR